MTTEFNKQNVRAIILAAGEGKRMKSDLPKVMHEFNGKPLIEYVVKSVEQANLGKPVVVVSAKNNLIQEYLGIRAEYVIQTEQLGTGHAVRCVESFLKGTTNAVVLYGDMPFVSEKSIVRLIGEHVSKNNTVTFLTTQIPSISWAAEQFAGHGRVSRDGNGQVQKIIEKKDLVSLEGNIGEVNGGVYCFVADWLLKNLEKLENNNSQQEYYLTDMVKIATMQHKKVSTVLIKWQEIVGINTRGHLVDAKKLDLQF